MRTLAAVSLLVLTAAAPVPPPAPLACDGQIAILYHNKIKEGGSLEGVAQAAKLQEGWYRAQGVADNKILVAKIVSFDRNTKQSSYAKDEVFTLHVNPPPPEKVAAGAAGGAPDYVQTYKTNATVLEKKTICLPKL